MMPNLKAFQTGLDRIADSTSLTKIVKVLGLLIVFFASTQLGLHFWPASSLVYGVRIDYLSPTLYFLDILIILYLFLSGFKSFTAVLPFLKYLIPISLVNLIYSHNSLSSLSWFIHLILILLFFLSFISSYKAVTRQFFAHVLSFTLIFQVVLASFQVYLGHSVGGLLYWVGERTVAVGQPSVALGSFMGQVTLRAYGTFSHPNILAGWLVVCCLIILFLYRRLSNLQTAALISFVSLGLLLTASRASLFAFIVFVIPFYFLTRFESRLLYFLFLIPLSFLLSSFTPSRATLSFKERVTLQQVSLKTLSHAPIFGTGANAAISLYPRVAPSNRLLQPDHNSFTLFLSWFGVFGLLSLIASTRLYFLKGLTYIIPLIPLFVLDHYFLTSIQGIFILLLYLALRFLSPRSS